MKIVKVFRKDDASAIPKEIKRQYEFTDWIEEQEFDNNGVQVDFIFNSNLNTVQTRLFGHTAGIYTKREFDKYIKSLIELQKWIEKKEIEVRKKFPQVKFV